IAQYVERLIAGSLALYRGHEQAERQRRLVDRLLRTLGEELSDADMQRHSLSTPLRRLLAIHTANEPSPQRPNTPLAHCALLTGARFDPDFGGQLRKELATADRIDILCSFIKWSGLRILFDDLRQLANRQPDIG